MAYAGESWQAALVRSASGMARSDAMMMHATCMLFHIVGKVKRWQAFFTLVHFAFGMRKPSLPWCTSLEACAGLVVTLAAPPTVRLLS